MRLIFILLFLMLSLEAKNKIALVIGNKAYQNQSSLKNPISDAKLIRDILIDMQFEVIEAYDVSIDTLDTKLNLFHQKASQAQIAVVYYAGHGIGVNGKNYIVPIGASGLSVHNLPRKLLSVDELKEGVAQASGFGLVLFDACRNSLFNGTIRGLSGRGSRALVRPKVTQKNVLLSFSTQPNTIAKDDIDNGSHSPYAMALNLYLKDNRDIRQVMGSVREKVWSLTASEQYPIEKNMLGGARYCLSGSCEQLSDDDIEKQKLRERIAMLEEQQKAPKKQQITHSNKGITTIEGLMYQNQRLTKKDDKNYYADKSSGRVQNWKGAIKYCKNLTLEGYSDWRLPKRDELRKLITKTTHKTASGYDRYIRADFANNLQKGSSFWTSEEKDSSNAWYVHFYNGYGSWFSKSSSDYALCVR